MVLHEIAKQRRISVCELIDPDWKGGEPSEAEVNYLLAAARIERIDAHQQRERDNDG